MSAQLELVSIPTDTLPLDGLLYEPEGRSAKAGVLLMHGNVGNFYSGPPRFLPGPLVSAGFACLAFNRRGHDILVNQVGREASGGAFQTAAEGMADNEYAAAFMASRGYSEPVVIGHSNGGMLAASFVARHPEVAALVLLSAHAGGPDTYRRSCAAGTMAGSDADEFEAKARELVAAGRGDELLLMPGWWYAVTAASLLDRIERTPSLLEAAPSVRCPVLAIRGSTESEKTYPMEEFARICGGPSIARIVDGANHWYTGREALVTDLITAWLTEALAPTEAASRS
jgi:pimeloyl-ACP methyl ester carboxylesterase